MVESESIGSDDNSQSERASRGTPKLVFGENRGLIKTYADIVEPMPAEWFENDGDPLDWQIDADSAEDL